MNSWLRLHGWNLIPLLGEEFYVMACWIHLNLSYPILLGWMVRISMLHNFTWNHSSNYFVKAKRTKRKNLSWFGNAGWYISIITIHTISCDLTKLYFIMKEIQLGGRRHNIQGVPYFIVGAIVNDGESSGSVGEPYAWQGLWGPCNAFWEQWELSSMTLTIYRFGWYQWSIIFIGMPEKAGGHGGCCRCARPRIISICSYHCHCRRFKK